MTLQRAAQTIITICMATKPTERVSIVYDKETSDIAEALFNASKEITTHTRLVGIPTPKYNGEEPPAGALENADVLLLTTSKSLTHTDARRKATDQGARCASLPGATTDMLARTIPIDYSSMNTLNKKLQNILTKGKQVQITTKKGTKITFSIENRNALIDSGLYHNRTDMGNLPAGEAEIAPLEESAEGTLVVDASMAGVGILKKPITLYFKNGYATIEGEEEAHLLKDFLKTFPKESFHLGEFAIGTNPAAQITGKTLEDEKVLGTCHCALGDNTSYPGGNMPAPTHLDGVITNPTVFVDGVCIMKEGNIY